MITATTSWDWHCWRSVIQSLAFQKYHKPSQHEQKEAPDLDFDVDQKSTTFHVQVQALLSVYQSGPAWCSCDWLRIFCSFVEPAHSRLLDDGQFDRVRYTNCILGSLEEGVKQIWISFRHSNILHYLVQRRLVPSKSDMTSRRDSACAHTLLLLMKHSIFFLPPGMLSYREIRFTGHAVVIRIVFPWFVLLTTMNLFQFLRIDLDQMNYWAINRFHVLDL